MSEIAWRLKHADEFFWEPIRRWWHRNRQVRIERDYWKGQLQEAEERAADFKERYDFQWEMRCKAEDERDVLTV